MIELSVNSLPSGIIDRLLPVKLRLCVHIYTRIERIINDPYWLCRPPSSPKGEKKTMMVSSRYAGLNHHISSSLARTRNSIYSFKKRESFFRGKKGREKKNVNKSSGAVRDGREHRHQRLDICKRERDRAIKYVNLCQSLPSFLPSYTFWSQLAFFFFFFSFSAPLARSCIWEASLKMARAGLME